MTEGSEKLDLLAGEMNRAANIAAMRSAKVNDRDILKNTIMGP